MHVVVGVAFVVTGPPVSQAKAYWAIPWSSVEADASRVTTWPVSTELGVA